MFLLEHIDKNLRYGFIMIRRDESDLTDMLFCCHCLRHLVELLTNNFNSFPNASSKITDIKATLSNLCGHEVSRSLLDDTSRYHSARRGAITALIVHPLSSIDHELRT